MSTFTRRSVLGGIVGVAASLAGCPETDQNSGSGFTNTVVDDSELVVEFESSLEADSINVIDPDGEGFASTDVSSGVSQVSFAVEMPYTPGEYRIVAASDGDEIAETAHVIEPELEIVDVGVGANRMDEMPEELHFPERQLLISVENSGTGPEAISNLSVSDEFPNPSSDDQGSGIFDQESGYGEVSEELIQSDSNTTIFSANVPFADYETECEQEGYSISANIRLTLEILDQTLKNESNLMYSASDSDNQCEVTISDN